MFDLDLFFQIVVAVLGLLLGSFANVIIHRLPIGESIVTPRSHCPKCKKAVKWFQNIPVVSYIFLRGKCSECDQPIGIKYPAVEILMAIGFWAAFKKFGIGFDLVEMCIFIFSLIVVSFIDLKHMILPDIFTLSGIAIGLAGSFASTQRTWLDSVWGILVGGGLLWLIAYLYLVLKKQEGMGGGDIKLLAWIGAVLGVKALPFVVLIASLAGSFAGLIAAAKSKEGLRTAIPFGPFLSAGAIIFVFAGQAITDWYLVFVSLR